MNKDIPFPASDQLRTLVSDTLGEKAANTKVFGCLTVRFTGENLPPLCDVLIPIIDEAVGIAGVTSSIWVRGTWGILGSHRQVNHGRDLHTKSGRSLLERIFSEVQKVPTTGDEPNITRLILSDGPRPEESKDVRGCWAEGSRLAENFGVRVRLQDNEEAAFIEVYFPLADLEDPLRREIWVKFGERVFETLEGSVGMLLPALWMEALIGEDIPVSLLAAAPMITYPTLVGVNAAGWSWPDMSPNPIEGLFEPPWITWLSSRLAEFVSDDFPGTIQPHDRYTMFRVEENAPLNMDEARYRRYRSAWAAFDALRIRWNRASIAADYSLNRFDAETFASLADMLTQQIAENKYDRELLQSFESALRKSEGQTALAIAEEEMARHPKEVWPHEHRLEAILCCYNNGQPDVHCAEKALSEAIAFAQEQNELCARLLLIVTQMYLAMDKREQALETLVRLEDTSVWILLKFEESLIALADDDRFRRVFGWVPLEAMEAYREATITPDLTAFPKLAQAVRGSVRCGQEVLFAQGASEDELAGTEQALGVELPAVYRSFLAATNGMVFCHGKEKLFSTKELITHNQDREDKFEVEIGRHLQLSLKLSLETSKDGEALLREYEGQGIRHEWKKLDNGLGNMLRTRVREMSEILTKSSSG